MPLRGFLAGCAALALLAAGPAVRAQEAPPLPAGLGAPAEPDLPSGLGGTAEPDLPSGLGGAEDAAPAEAGSSEPFRAPLGLTGFIEGRAGARIVDDATEKDLSIAETRLQLARDVYTRAARFRFVGDLLYDGVEDDLDIDLETGRGWFDLREANMVVQPLPFMDVKAGRQILTWGVGDLLFINDLFPKDYRSFFIGRDDEYLKAPSDAVRVSAFSDVANIEVVYTPRFDADRYVDGSRLSYFNPALGRIAGRDAVIDAETPDTWFADDEIATRIYRNLGGFEVAAYGYSGYWKTPEGQTAAGQPIHPRLAVVGASLRGPLGGGILTGEFGQYMSLDDRDGDDPLIRNGESRFLAGYEKEIGEELTAAGQYYVELLSDYDALKGALPAGSDVPDRARHVLTLRLTKLLLNQNLTLSAFNFWSPNEEDGYARFRATYKLTDAWAVEGGGNVFYGEDENSFFGQFQDNTNLFVSIRRSF